MKSNSKQRSKRKPSRAPFALSYALEFFKAVDTPRSLMLSLLIENKQYEDLVKVGIDSYHYNDVRRFFLDYQCTKLLAKCVDFSTGIDTRRVAIDSFLKAEISCAVTNHMYQLNLRGEFHFRPAVASIFHMMRQKISSILGDVPEYSQLNFGFGPGANVSVKGDTSIYKKLESALECTFALTPVLPELLAEFPAWLPEGNHSVNIADGSELTFVPKNAKTMRPICIEPLLNGLYQKGLGSYLKERLFKAGIDLRDQTINQRLANSAVAMKLATVDFSSASDMISYHTVLDLTPMDWLIMLDYGRSPCYTYENQKYDFHKFSSMGNAYTFELESLIFGVAAIAVTEYLGIKPLMQKNISVYGDDVIIPEECFDLFVEVSECLGFTINKEKSFTKGLFRESCGADSFDGFIVTPFKIESLKEDKDVYKTANQLLNIVERTISCPSNDLNTIASITRLWNLHGWLVSRVPQSSRHVVPATAGDVGFHCPLDAAVSSKRVRRSKDKDGWNFDSKRWRAARITPEQHVPAGLPTWGPSFCERDERVNLNQGYRRCPLTGRVGRFSGPSFRSLYEIGVSSNIDTPLGSSHSKFFYELRSQGQYVVKRSFQFGQWVDPAVAWPDRSLGLIAKVRNLPRVSGKKVSAPTHCA